MIRLTAGGAWPRTRTAAPDGLLAALWQHRQGRAGLLLMLALVLLAVLGPALLPHDPNLPNYAKTLAAPSAEHWLGTDATGRDQLARLADGAHRSLGGAALVMALVFGVGLVVGVVAAVAGGLLDIILMRMVDVMMALPGLIFAFAVLGLLGPGYLNLLFALAVADWAYYARLARATALDAAARPHVEAARMMGRAPWQVLIAHILPAVAWQLAVLATLGMGGMIAAISAFSFLGLGVQVPHAEWGAMLADSRFYFTIAPWLLIAPAALIFAAVLASNQLCEALRDITTPEGRS